MNAFHSIIRTGASRNVTNINVPITRKAITRASSEYNVAFTLFENGNLIFWRVVLLSFK